MSKIAPRFLKSGSFKSCLAIPVSVSSVNLVRKSIGCDAAFLRSIKTLELFSAYNVSFVRPVARDFFVDFPAAGPSTELSMIVLRERCSVLWYIVLCSSVMWHHSIRSVLLGRSLSTWECGINHQNASRVYIMHTWSFRRRRTNGVIIVLARDMRSWDSKLTFVSPLTLNMVRKVSIEPANCSGRIKLSNDCGQIVDDRNSRYVRKHLPLTPVNCSAGGFRSKEVASESHISAVIGIAVIGNSSKHGLHHKHSTLYVVKRGR